MPAGAEIDAERLEERAEGRLARAVRRGRRQPPRCPRGSRRRRGVPRCCAMKTGMAATRVARAPRMFTSRTGPTSDHSEPAAALDVPAPGVGDDHVEAAELAIRAPNGLGGGVRVAHVDRDARSPPRRAPAPRPRPPRARPARRAQRAIRAPPRRTPGRARDRCRSRRR